MILESSTVVSVPFIVNVPVTVVVSKVLLLPVITKLSAMLQPVIVALFAVISMSESASVNVSVVSHLRFPYSPYRP